MTQKAVGLLPDNCAEKHAVATYLPVKTELPEATSYAPLTTEFDSGSSAKAALPRLTLYMLQMGVYSTEENAQEQSERLKKLGAAGYIYNDNGVYRVIASAYLNEEDAQSVKDRLNREGYACTIYKLERSGAELLITTDNQHLASIEKAFDTAGCIVAGVSDISIDFDAEERSVEYASKAVERLRVELAEASASIFGSAQTNELLMYLYNYLNDMNEILGREEAVSDRAAYSSAIKQITVVGALRYASLLQQICN